MNETGSVTTGFPPIAGDGMRTLILGSLPSRKSLELGQYYGHPQNAFWRIMGRLIDAGPGVDYAERTRRLVAAGIGVWDVLEASVRPGSMDADIDLATAVPNDFVAFLAEHPAVARIFFNGRAAADLFRRKVLAATPSIGDLVALDTLPSTSPAYASMAFEEKLRRWAVVIA